MLALLLGLTTNRLDDANWVSFGGAGAFVPHKTIRMLGEDVNITLYDDKIHVRVYFSFENKGEATTVKMAFPFEGTGYTGEPEDILAFATKVDGVPVSVERVKIAPFTRVGKEFRTAGFDIANPYALVKEVSFEKGQWRTILVDYTVLRAGFGIGCTADEYVLHTGATWAGTIGQCTITVDWSAEKEQGRPRLEFDRPDGTSFPTTWTYLGPRHATVTLNAFEPDFDLSLSSVCNFWNLTLNGKTMSPYRGASIHDASFDGSWSDPTIQDSGLYDFFTEKYEDKRNFIHGPIGNAFGNALKLIDATTLLDGMGRKHKLKRKAGTDGGHGGPVFLKDVVEALGGTFKYVPEWERIDITMPTREKPLRKPGEPVPPL